MKKKVIKKKRTKSQKTLNREALANWSKEIRKTGKCLACERTDHLQAHHILAKEVYKEFKLDLMNGVPLCPTHHKFCRHSAHRNPVWFCRLLELFASDKLKWAFTHY
jgi:hypothetical protein